MIDWLIECTSVINIDAYCGSFLRINPSVDTALPTPSPMYLLHICESRSGFWIESKNSNKFFSIGDGCSLLFSMNCQVTECMQSVVTLERLGPHPTAGFNTFPAVCNNFLDQTSLGLHLRAFEEHFN